MNDRRMISRRTLVKSGLGAIAAPTVLRVLPAEAQSQVIKIGHDGRGCHRRDAVGAKRALGNGR